MTMHCAKHGTAAEAHPYYHDKGIHCAECATEHERREEARRADPARYVEWLREIATFLAEHDASFECDCEPTIEYDVNAVIHADSCAAHWQDHIDIVLREAAERIALDTAEIARLRTHLEAIRAYCDDPLSVNAEGMTAAQKVGGMWSQSVAALS